MGRRGRALFTTPDPGLPSPLGQQPRGPVRVGSPAAFSTKELPSVQSATGACSTLGGRDRKGGVHQDLRSALQPGASGQAWPAG